MEQQDQVKASSGGEGSLRIAGLRTRFRQNGQGPDVLFLHGWGNSLAAFDAISPMLGRHYRLTSFDFPGHGESEPPSTAWGSEQFAAFTLELMNALDVQTPIMVAHSFGARIAIRLAKEQPSRVGALVIIGGAGIRPRRTLSYRLRVGTAKALKWILGSFGQAGHAVREKAMAALGSRDLRAAGALRPSFIKIVNEDQRSMLPGITAKTLLIWGARDCETPLRAGQEMNRLIKGSRLVVLKGSGHFPHAEEPTRVGLEIGRFLRTNSSSIQ